MSEHTKTQATPRPWKLILPIHEEEGEETDEGGQIAIHMGDRITSPGMFTTGNEIILDNNCLPGENKIAEANAKFIVKAVNNYEQMLYALKEAEFFIRNSIEQQSKHQDSLTIVRKAIQEAKVDL